MAKTQTKAFNQTRPMYLPDDAGSEDTTILVEFASAAYASGDLIELAIIPVGYRCLDWTLIFDDIDSNVSPAIAWSLGIENAGGTDLGTEVWGTGLTAGQTTSIVRNTTNVSALGDITTDRKLALKCTTIAATYAGSGKTGYVVLKLQG